MTLLKIVGLFCTILLVNASSSKTAMFLRSDGELLVSKSVTIPRFSETYMLPSCYAGFTNQRLSFYVAAYYCLLYNITLVLPELLFDYGYVEGKIRPFEYFYSIDEAVMSSDENTRHLKIVHSVPAHLLPACFAQLQTMSTQNNYLPSQETLNKYKTNHGVICLHSDGTFYGLANAIQNATNLIYFLDYQLTPTVQSLRSMFVVNEMYQRITIHLLNRMKLLYGHTNFLSVHVRNEPDFVHACRYWPRRRWSDDSPDRLRACLQDDTVIYDSLTSPLINIPLNNSILLIMNFDSEDLTFANMSTLCHHRCDGPDAGDRCYVFHCIRKESLISSAELLQTFPDLVNTPTSLAMIDDQLAQHGILFFGNMYSTMSVEIYHERRLGRTPYTESVFYNRYCSSYSRTNVSECP